MKLTFRNCIQPLAIILFFTGMWQSYAEPKTQTLQFNINPLDCSRDLNRINTLSFECHVKRKDAPQQGTWIITRADHITQRYGDCTVEASANIYGYRVKIAKDWHPKQNYFIKDDALACLRKSIQDGKLDQIPLYSSSNRLE